MSDQQDACGRQFAQHADRAACSPLHVINNWRQRQVFSDIHIHMIDSGDAALISQDHSGSCSQSHCLNENLSVSSHQLHPVNGRNDKKPGSVLRLNSSLAAASCYCSDTQIWEKDIPAHCASLYRRDFSHSEHISREKSENLNKSLLSASGVLTGLKYPSDFIAPSSSLESGTYRSAGYNCSGPLRLDHPAADPVRLCDTDFSSVMKDNKQKLVVDLTKSSVFISKYFPSSCVPSPTFNLKKAISMKYAESMKSSVSTVAKCSTVISSDSLYHSPSTSSWPNTCISQSGSPDGRELFVDPPNKEMQSETRGPAYVSDSSVSSTSRAESVVSVRIRQDTECQLPQRSTRHTDSTVAQEHGGHIVILPLKRGEEHTVTGLDEWSHLPLKETTRGDSQTGPINDTTKICCSSGITENRKLVTDSSHQGSDILETTDMSKLETKTFKDDTLELPHTTGWEISPKKAHNGLCQVCCDMAAGFYCGAFVCEACKKFFIRASKQEKNKFVCLRQRSCKITKESRVQCQYCRYQRCLELQMYYPGEGKRSVARVGISEIPCRVCAAPSSGFHFGALTCEGCKGFFRRMVKEREPETYRCSAGGVCEISAHTRNMCKACRYQKCVSIGMSVEGSRIGRQPNAVKHAISLEVKKQCGDVGSKMGPTSCIEASISGSSMATITSQSLPTSAECASSPPPAVHIKQETGSPSFSFADVELFEVPASQTVPVCMKEAPGDDVDYSMMEASLQAAGTELAHIVLKERAQSDMFDEQSFSSMSSIWSKMMRHFEFHAQCIIRFAKKVPGFRKLEIDDQVTLVQHSTYPLVILNHARSYELDTGYYNYFNFTKREETAIFQAVPVFLTLQKHFRHMGLIAQTMNLTDLEYTLLSCMLLLDSECHGLKAVQKVMDLQNQILLFFQLYEERTHEDGSSRFGEMMLRISELALANVQHGQTIATFMAQHPNLEVPRLFHEMFF